MADEPIQEDLTGVDPERLMAALSYMAFLVFVPLAVARDNPFVMTHAKQGLVVFIGLVLSIILANWIPVVGTVLFLLLVLLSLAGIIQALLGRRWRMPIVGAIATKFRA